MKRSLRRPIIAYNRRKTTERMAIAVLRPSTCLLLIVAGGCILGAAALSRTDTLPAPAGDLQVQVDRQNPQ